MKKLLELLGTILITTSAAGALVANKPNNKIKNSLQTLSRKKRQTPPTNEKKQQNKTGTSNDSQDGDNATEFIEKEITLNENYSKNIKNMLQELIKNNQLDPLRIINNEGIVRTDYFETQNKRNERESNIKIIEKLEEILELRKFDVNKIRILVLTLKNRNNKSIKLVINLSNFYVLGFINNQNQYFHFDDELLEKIKQNNQNEIIELEKIKTNLGILNELIKDKSKDETKKEKLEWEIKEKLNKLKALEKNPNIENIDELIKTEINKAKELDKLNKKLNEAKAKKEKNEQQINELETRIKDFPRPNIPIPAINYKNDNGYLDNKIKNLQGESLKTEEEKIKTLNTKVTEKYKCQKINLKYTGAYTSAGLNVVIKENGKPDKGKDIIISKDTLNNAIKNLHNYDNNQENQSIKDDLARLIFITSEAMRFGSYLKYFNYEKGGKQVEFKNIPEDIQNIINSKNDDKIQWKDYSEQLIGGWIASSKYLEQKRKGIFKDISTEFDYYELLNIIFSDKNKFKKINLELELKKEKNDEFINANSKNKEIKLNEINEEKLWENCNISENQIADLKNIIEQEIENYFKHLNSKEIIEKKEELWNIFKNKIKNILLKQVLTFQQDNQKEQNMPLFFKNEKDMNNLKFKKIDLIMCLISHHNIDLLELLILKCPEIVNLEANFYKPLLIAIANGDLEVVKLLIKYGVNVNTKNIFGYTALQTAIFYFKYNKNNLKIIKELLKHKDIKVEEKDYLNRSALDIAISEHYSEALMLLLKSGKIKSNLSKIEFSAVQGNLDAIQLLIDNGVDLNKINFAGSFLLHYAVFKNNKEFVEALLKYPNINVNVESTEGLRVAPLHYAVEDENIEIMKLLLKRGANLNIKNKNNDTPLHDAISTNKEKAIKWLLSNGADINIINNDNKKPIDLCKNETIKLLLKTFLEEKIKKDEELLNNLSENLTRKQKEKLKAEIRLRIKKNKRTLGQLLKIKLSDSQANETTLSNIITKTYLGTIKDNSDKVILNTFIEQNEKFKNFSRGQLYATNITNNSAIINSPAPNIYTGKVKVTFTIKKETSSIQPQLGSSNSDNQDDGSRYGRTGKNSDTTNQSSNSGNAGLNSSRVSVGEQAGTSGTQQQNNLYDVRADDSCLFWSVVMSYLLPVRNNDEEFERRFIQLFGSLQLSYLSHVQNLLQQFDLINSSSRQAWYQNATANRLVRLVLRNRIVDYIEANLDTIANNNSELTFRNLVQENNEIADNYLENMRQPSTWGGLPEIIAMANMLNANISVDNENPYQPVNQNSNTNINLSYVELKEGSGVKNHYNFDLSEETRNTKEEFRNANVVNEQQPTENSREVDTKLEQQSCPNSLDSTPNSNSSKNKLPVDDHSQYHQTITKNDDNNNGNSAIKKAINKYNELSKDEKQQKLNEINQHFQSLPENEKKEYKDKLKSIGSAALGGGISAVGTAITISGKTASATSSLTAAEAIEMTPLLTEGTAVATEGTIIGGEAAIAGGLAPETLGLSLLIGGLAIAGTAVIWWLSDHDNSQSEKHEKDNQYNEIEKYYKFLKHDQLKLDINSETWDKIKQIYQENKNNFEIFKNKIKSEITSFYKEDHSGWGGSISDDDINILIKIMFNHFEEIDNHFTNNSNHGWKIITNTIGSYFQLDSE